MTDANAISSKPFEKELVDLLKEAMTIGVDPVHILGILTLQAEFFKTSMTFQMLEQSREVSKKKEQSNEQQT